MATTTFHRQKCDNGASSRRSLQLLVETSKLDSGNWKLETEKAPNGAFSAYDVSFLTVVAFIYCSPGTGFLPVFARISSSQVTS